MRSLERNNKPDILIEKELEWLEKILQTPDKRPGTHTYRHPKILQALLSTSYHKCFYCETLLKGVPKEIDHHIEYKIDITLAVDWDNLYLSCISCNDKLNHNEIPVTEALDPCKHSDIEIQEHICYEDEIILPNNNSALGRKTIKKYNLGSEKAEFVRMKEFRKFNDVFQDIYLKCTEEGRKPSPQEIERLKNFALIEKSYSLMFLQKLKKIGLVL